MQISPTRLVELDNMCDYVPGLSTVTNLVALFEKSVYKCLSESQAKNRYWTHINDKSLYRCLLLIFLPGIGNLFILIYDYFEYKKDKKICDSARVLSQDFYSEQAQYLSTYAIVETGLIVRKDEMMPAPTEEQRRLWAGCSRNNLQIVKEQLAKGISPDFYHVGQRPLVVACLRGSSDIIGALIKQGAGVYTADRFGMTPSMAACMRGEVDIFKVLWPSILDVNAPIYKGMTYLKLASERGFIDLVKFLRERGADSKQKFPDGSDAVSCAIFYQDNEELLDALFDENEDIDERRYQFSEGSFTPSPSSPSLKNLTPLLYAAIVGKEKLALHLLGRSNIFRRDFALNNVLYYAVNHIDLLEALLAASDLAEFINNKNVAGATAMHHAIAQQKPEAALLLLKKGADPLIPNKERKTALILAWEKGYDEIVKCILWDQQEKITHEMAEKVAVRADPSHSHQAQVDHNSSFISFVNDLLYASVSHMQIIQSELEESAKYEEEIFERGPFPRTGGELLFGKLPWPS